MIVTSDSQYLTLILILIELINNYAVTINTIKLHINSYQEFIYSNFSRKQIFKEKYFCEIFIYLFYHHFYNDKDNKISLSLSCNL